MASGQIHTIKLMRGDNSSPWGFRLQGGKDFSMPLSVVKVNPGTLADQGGVQIGDVVLKINGKNAEVMRHKEAQDVIFNTGNNLELTCQRGQMTTWRPNVTPAGNYRPSSRLFDDPTPLTKTSLAHNQQDYRPIGSGHNAVAAPFPNSAVQLVNKQYNSPINIYSEKNIAETIQAHTEILSSGVKGINFLKPDMPVNTQSPVYQMVHDEEEARVRGDTDTYDGKRSQLSPRTATIHVEAPITKPASEYLDKQTQNICAECGKVILGVFVRIKDRSLHAECFRCSTCGTSLKNVGYFNINEKLYCDIHAKQVANLISPGGEILPVPPPNRLSPNIGSGMSPPMISIPPPSDKPYSSGLSPTGVVSAIPYHSTQGVYHVNPPSLLSTASTFSSTSYSVPKRVPKPQFKASTLYGNTDGFRHSTGGGKFQWPPPSSSSISYASNTPPVPTYRPPPGTQHMNHETIKITDTKSTSYITNPSQYQSRSPEAISYTPSFMQSVKVPPPTAPKPQINPPWTGTSTIPGPGQSSIPGSRPAPRRGRGLLKPQTIGTIPICSFCGGPIRGPFIVALGKTWCPTHFTCATPHCRRPLQDIGFVEEHGQLYCENCYEGYLAPICAKCNLRIKGDCLNALEKQWHPNCFICAYCRKPFGNSSFYLEDGFPYCESDWNELFTTKCVGCGYPIEAGDRWVEALNQNFHSQCFRCSICGKNLEGQSFYAKGGKPFCKLHAR